MTVEQEARSIGLEVPTRKFAALATPGGCVQFNNEVGAHTEFPALTGYSNACAHYWTPGALVLEEDSYIEIDTGEYITFGRHVGARRFKTYGAFDPFADEPLPQVALACGYSATLAVSKVIQTVAVYLGEIIGVEARILPAIRTHTENRGTREWLMRDVALNFKVRVGGYVAGAGGLAEDLMTGSASDPLTVEPYGKVRLERNNNREDDLCPSLYSKVGLATRIRDAYIHLTSITWTH